MKNVCSIYYNYTMTNYTFLLHGFNISKIPIAFSYNKSAINLSISERIYMHIAQIICVCMLCVHVCVCMCVCVCV